MSVCHSPPQKPCGSGELAGERAHARPGAGEAASARDPAAPIPPTGTTRCRSRGPRTPKHSQDAATRLKGPPKLCKIPHLEVVPSLEPGAMSTGSLTCERVILARGERPRTLQTGTWVATGPTAQSAMGRYSGKGAEGFSGWETGVATAHAHDCRSINGTGKRIRRAPH
jgi:hypothetical protein